MKPTDAKAPKFDGKWWKANKAKDADADGSFEKALDKYQQLKAKHFKDLIEAQNVVPGSNDVQTALQTVKALAEKKKGDPKLDALQKETKDATKDALANYEKRCDAAIAYLHDARRSQIMTTPATTLIKSGDAQFKQFCQKDHSDENYIFFALMARKPSKGLPMYDHFVAKDAKTTRINLPHNVQGPLDKIAADIKAKKATDTPAAWGNAWREAVTAVTITLENDILPRFRSHALEQMLRAKLP